MPKRNYGLERRRKEADRKARQKLKQERRKARPPEESAAVPVAADANDAPEQA